MGKIRAGESLREVLKMEELWASVSRQNQKYKEEFDSFFGEQKLEIEQLINSLKGKGYLTMEQARQQKNITLTIAGWSASAPYSQTVVIEGITDKERFGEFEDAYDVILRFYDEFMNTPEGGEECYKILLIDEIAGLLTHYSMSKDGKAKADKIRNIMSSILMLGRSRKCFLWLSMQRYTASIFPASSGSADNFHIYVGLGRLTVDGRKGLFAGEHMEGEENLQFGMGKGIVLIDGQNLRALVLPKISKKKILGLLQN